MCWFINLREYRGCEEGHRNRSASPDRRGAQPGAGRPSGGSSPGRLEERAVVTLRDFPAETGIHQGETWEDTHRRPESCAWWAVQVGPAAGLLQRRDAVWSRLVVRAGLQEQGSEGWGLAGDEGKGKKCGAENTKRLQAWYEGASANMLGPAGVREWLRAGWADLEISRIRTGRTPSDHVYLVSWDQWQQQSQHGQRPVEKDQTRNVQDQYQHRAEAAKGRGKSPSL